MSNFKPIKITPSNSDAIETALKAVNGNAREHTFLEFFEIRDLAQITERKIENMGIAKARRAGALVCVTSGSKVANAYKSTRIGTTVTLERRSADWYLTSIKTATLFKEGGSTTMHLTAAQDAEAVANLRKQYYVQAAFLTRLPPVTA